MREAKDKRMKKIAIGGAVLLVAVLAFEVPKVMHLGGKAASSPPAATTTTPSTSTTTPPTSAAAAVQPTAGTASTRLPNSDVAPKRAKSQLLTFSHFAGKDPFVQQVNEPTLGALNGGAAGASGGGSGPAGLNTAPVSVTAAVKSPKASSVRTLATTGAVKIQVNGRIETVKVGGSFPSSIPLFRLVSAGQGTAKIGIANGSYASGAHTVSLTAGQTVTLVDTADGVRYKIRLAS
jgi:hypothetical protein